MNLTPDFLCARCPECGIVWTSYSRTDLRLLEHGVRLVPKAIHEKFEREWPTASLERKEALLEETKHARGHCAGSDRVLQASEYGENGDPRFDCPDGCPECRADFVEVERCPHITEDAVQITHILGRQCIVSASKLPWLSERPPIFIHPLVVATIEREIREGRMEW